MYMYEGGAQKFFMIQDFGFQGFRYWKTTEEFFTGEFRLDFSIENIENRGGDFLSTSLWLHSLPLI